MYVHMYHIDAYFLCVFGVRPERSLHALLMPRGRYIFINSNDATSQPTSHENAIRCYMNDCR